jgi:hypothetical protein
MKESLEGLIQSPQGLLERTIVARSKSIAFFSELWKESRGLLGVAKTLAGSLVGLFPFSKRLVVEEAVSVKLKSKSLRLVASRVKSIFERLEHLLSLLARNVVFNYGITYKPNGADIVTTRPKSRKFLPKVLVLSPEFMRSKPFELLNNIMNWQCRLAGHKDMNMIGHYFKSLYRHINLSSLLFYKSLKVSGNLIDQDGFSILWTPYYVIVDIINATSRYFVSIVCHINKLYVWQKIKKKL